MKTQEQRLEELFRLIDGRALVASGRARELREHFGISVIDIARICGSTPASVSRWERRKRIPRGEAGHRYTDLIVALEKKSNGDS